MARCYVCSQDPTVPSERKVVSETVNSSRDMKTLKLDCGHTITSAIIQGLTHFSTSELKKKLSYAKKMAKIKYLSKAYRDSNLALIVELEAELRDRRA